MLYPEETVQSQYAASPTIRALVDGFNKLVDPRDDIQLFFDKYFNLDTAKGFGLDCWARIVGVSRSIWLEKVGKNFGYFTTENEVPYVENTYKGFMPWDQGVFGEPGADGKGNYLIGDAAFKEFILWKALANISTGDAYTLNRLLSKLMGQSVIVSETGVMQIRITTTSPLENWQKAVMTQYGMFGKPAGVGYDFYTIETPVFGMVEDGDNYGTFGEAPFFNGTATADFVGS